jgi:UDP-galactopyranose mutase
MKQYDYLVIGAGLYGALYSFFARQAGKSVLVIDRRDHIGGNLYCEKVEDITVHKYGPHIFHTSDIDVWKFVNGFVKFNNFINAPLAYYKGEIYNLPFNMNTFYKLWGTIKPDDAKREIEKQVKAFFISEPKNMEEQALALVGSDIYERLIKGYTEKQWGRAAKEIPAFIIKRLPLRFTYNNNYFKDPYQGIPEGGYNGLIAKLLDGVQVKTGIDFLSNKAELESISTSTIYTGCIDEYYNYCFGELEYRGLKFDTEVLDIDNFQGNAVVNYTEKDVPFTRIVEHKHFEFGEQSKTVITKEYAMDWQRGEEPYYPINDDRNNLLYSKYLKLSEKEIRVSFGGRLGEYKYYDMDKIVAKVLAIRDSI